KGHRPPGPRHGTGYYETPPSTDSSVLFQPPHIENPDELAKQLAEQAEKGSGDIKIDDYQRWCELNWKQPHGTTWSQERFNKKLDEELRELQQELEAGTLD